MKHFTWEYEESTTNYYHIYPVSEAGEDLCLAAITLDAPQTKHNDLRANQIEAVLDAMAADNAGVY